MRPRFVPVRASLSSAADSLQAATPTNDACSVGVSLSYDIGARDSQGNNLAILNVDQMASPDADVDHDLQLSGPLLRALLWTGANNPMHPDILDGRSETLRGELEATAAIRYVLAWRYADRSVSTRAAIAKVHAFLVDLETPTAQVCSFEVPVRSTQVYEIVPGQSREQRLGDSLFTDARRALLLALAERIPDARIEAGPPPRADPMPDPVGEYGRFRDRLGE